MKINQNKARLFGHAVGIFALLCVPLTLLLLGICMTTPVGDQWVGGAKAPAWVSWTVVIPSLISGVVGIAALLVGIFAHRTWTALDGVLGLVSGFVCLFGAGFTMAMMQIT